MKMRTFQQVWSRILILAFTILLSLISGDIWVPDEIVKWIFAGIIVSLGTWGVIWEYWHRDMRRLTRDGFGFKQFFSKWYNRPGELVICCGKLAWLSVERGSKSDKKILDALTLTNNRISHNSKLKVITAEMNDDQLRELWKRLNFHNAIEIFQVDSKTIEKFSFSRYAASGDAYQYIIKYNAEDKDGYIFEHAIVSEAAFIDNLIEESCDEETRRDLDNPPDFLWISPSKRDKAKDTLET